MLHLPRGIALGVDIADFLQLERPLERHRIVRPAPQIEHVARRNDEVRHRGDLLVMRKRVVQRLGRLPQMTDDFALLGRAQLTLGPRQIGGQRGKHRQLAGERLG